MLGSFDRMEPHISPVKSGLGCKHSVKALMAVMFCGLCLSSITAYSHSDSSDFFEMSLLELMSTNISVASLTEKQALFQPSTVTVIERSAIDQSAAQTLSDLLMQYVPGYFRAEDKDDTIASFRGVAPDNNSKVMMLVNGMKVNANWFWGPPDSLLNSLDLSFIDRIEVVSGPGNVTLGQGAQLGVINVITYNSLTAPANSVFLKTGNDHWLAGGMAVGEHDGHHWYVQASALDKDGYKLANKGWANEVVESDSAHPNPAALRGNRLNRGESYRLLADYQFNDLRLQLQHHQQQRDLYNWTKDRDQVEQRLTVAALDYDWTWSEALSTDLNMTWQLDDYALYDLTTGLTTGGAREERWSVKPQLRWHSTDNPINRIVLGFENEYFATGETNWQGDNFIVNQTSDLTPAVNQTNTWVFKDSYQSRAVYGEFNWQIFGPWRTNLGIRYDDHPQWGSNETLRGSVFYSINDDQVLRLTYQEGFRGPPGVHYSGGFLRDGLLSESNFNQLSGTGMTSSSTGELINTLENPEPEFLSVYELAYSAYFTEAFYFQATAYAQKIKNIIITESTRNGTAESAVGSDLVGTWGGVFYYANAPGELEISGLESSIIYQQPSWRHELSISHSEVTSADGFDFGLKSPVAGSSGNIHSNGVPEQVLRYQGHWKVNDRLAINYHHLYLTYWWAPWLNEKVSGFGWGNVVAQYQWTQKARVKVAVENIWGQNNLYPVRARGKNNEESGTPALVPRTLTLSLDYRF